MGRPGGRGGLRKKRRKKDKLQQQQKENPASRSGMVLKAAMMVTGPGLGGRHSGERRLIWGSANRQRTDPERRSGESMQVINQSKGSGLWYDGISHMHMSCCCCCFSSRALSSKLWTSQALLHAD